MNDYISDIDYERLERGDEKRRKERRPMPDVQKAESEFRPLSPEELRESERAFEGK